MVAGFLTEGLADEGDGEEEPAEGERSPLVGMLPGEGEGVIDGADLDAWFVGGLLVWIGGHAGWWCVRLGVWGEICGEGRGGAD